MTSSEVGERWVVEGNNTVVVVYCDVFEEEVVKYTQKEEATKYSDIAPEIAMVEREKLNKDMEIVLGDQQWRLPLTWIVRVEDI